MMDYSITHPDRQSVEATRLHYPEAGAGVTTRPASVWQENTEEPVAPPEWLNEDVPRSPQPDADVMVTSQSPIVEEQEEE